MRRRGRNSFVSFIALLLILYFIGLPLLAAFLTSRFGSVTDAISDLVDLLPFGNGILHVAILIMNGMVGPGLSYQETQGYLSISYVFGELSKSVFIMFIFEILNFFGNALLMLDSGGKWNNLKKIALTAFNALLAACLAPWFINIALDQIQKAATNGTTAGVIVSTIVSHLLFFIVTGGAIALFCLVMGATIAEALIFVLVKKVAMDFCRLILSYLCILLALLGLSIGNRGIMYGGILLMLAIAIVFAGIDLMLEPVRN